jgi:hypothetical protein
LDIEFLKDISLLLITYSVGAKALMAVTSDQEEYSLLGCNAMSFRKNDISVEHITSYSGSKSKQSKKSAKQVAS